MNADGLDWRLEEAIGVTEILWVLSSERMTADDGMTMLLRAGISSLSIV
jgi:hypothetical protein